jgi:hypothetical protein
MTLNAPDLLPLLIVLAGLITSSSDIRTVDLTRIETASIGEPGADHSGCGGCAPEKQYQLPLSIEIADVKDIEKRKSELEVIVTNTGSIDFQLPIERRGLFFKQGGSQRKSFSFLLRVENASTHAVSETVIAVTGSSDLRPSSYLQLSPGERVLVKMLWNHSDIHVDPMSPEAFITAGCSEYVLKKNEFVIKERSKEIFGTVNKTVRLQ